MARNRSYSTRHNSQLLELSGAGVIPPACTACTAVAVKGSKLHEYNSEINVAIMLYAA